MNLEHSTLYSGHKDFTSADEKLCSEHNQSDITDLLTG